MKTIQVNNPKKVKFKDLELGDTFLAPRYSRGIYVGENLWMKVKDAYLNHNIHTYDGRRTNVLNCVDFNGITANTYEEEFVTPVKSELIYE